MDDFFMCRFFEGNIECTELVLRIILNRNDLHVERVEAQQTIKSIVGKGVRLDVLAVDDAGKYYNIEVQRAKDGADFRRARLNSSLLYNYITKEGDNYSDLPETYIIFITEKDIIGAGCAVYEIEKTIKQTNQKIDDGTHMIFVNGAYRGKDALGKLMEDFCNPDYKTMHYVQLQKRSEYLKEKEGESSMCAFTEEVLAMGEAKAILQSVRNLMANLKMSAQAAMDVLNVPAEDRPAILAALGIVQA